MWRWLMGGVAGVAAIGAGALLLTSRETPSVAALPAPPPEQAADAEQEALPASVPEATAKTREEKRFGRYDKDRDGRITRDEYLAARRKAFAKLDKDGDGRLSFDEWAVKATAKFDGADRDRSGAMDAGEFATTAVKRKTRAPLKCPPVRDEG